MQLKDKVAAVSRVRRAGVLFAVAWVLGAGGAAAGVTEFSPEGPYTQASSGMTFPLEIGPFKRVKTIRYDTKGDDESVGYNRETPMAEITATVYLFPSPSLVSIGSPQSVIDGARAHLCESQFQAIKSEVTIAHRDAVFVREGNTTLAQGQATHSGHAAFYTLTNDNYFGRRNVALRSEAYVFCYAGGKWTVEYRFDYPADTNASQTIADFMHDLTWTISPEK